MHSKFWYSDPLQYEPSKSNVSTQEFPRNYEGKAIDSIVKSTPCVATLSLQT